MSKISTVFCRSGGALRRGVMLVSVFLLALLTLQGCGNKGDLYRESDAAVIDDLQQATDILKQRNESADSEEDDDEKKEKKTNSENESNPVQTSPDPSATGN